MPDTENLTSDNARAANRNPYTLWFVVIAFVLPVVGAYTLYFTGYTPSAFTNKGELIQPVVDVGTLALVDDRGEALSREAITQRKWQMIYFAGAACGQDCNDTLYKIRQVNKAVGKNAYRLRRLIVHLDAPDAEFFELISEEYPEARRLYADRQTIMAALQAIGAQPDASDIYLMDPLGNIMMRFTGDMPGKWLIHDLNKLFKVSQIG
jgi:cytochrome oxidase Cu insertion factor (SCO1/SenC/PrrC family)